MADNRVPGAINLTSDELTNAMVVPLLGNPRNIQTTLGEVAEFVGSFVQGLLAATALTTVGAGTITAAAIAGGITTRSGSQSNTAFTDTSGTAVAIIAALPNAEVGSGFLYWYVNNTNATATLAGGVGVTLSATVPAGCTAVFLAKVATSTTMTFTKISQSVPATVSGTVTATAATPVVVANTNVTANSTIILSYKSGTQGATGAFVSSLTAGTGFSINSVASDTALYNYLIIN